MSIKEQDLDAVRAVLGVPDPPGFMLVRMTNQEAALLAVTIIIATDRLSFPGRSFGKTISRLVIEPAVPPGGWRSSKEPDNWYYRRERIITASRELGLHHSATKSGTNTSVLGAPELFALLEEPGLLERARAWFDRCTRGATLPLPLARDDPATVMQRRVSLQAEITADPLLGPLLTGYDEISLELIWSRLGKKLIKYFPPRS